MNMEKNKPKSPGICVEDPRDVMPEITECPESVLHALSPNCAGCGIKILNHGYDINGVYFCSVHCAEISGKLDQVHRTHLKSNFADSEF